MVKLLTEATTELNEESKFPLPSSPPPPKSSLEIKELPPLLFSPPFCRCLNGHHIKRSKLDYDWYCDRCKDHFDPSVSAHGCKECDYDICDSCCRKAWMTPYVHVDEETGKERTVDEPRPYVIPPGILDLIVDQTDYHISSGGSFHVTEVETIHSSLEEISF
jgi:hypothetical protein